MINALSQGHFENQFARFQRLIIANDKGHAFTNFQEGIAGAWENYKPRLRQHALSILSVEQWSEGSIGSGAILRHTIDAIEIQDSRLNLTNNLVFWLNQYGHANRDHKVLLEAVVDPKLCRNLEKLLFGLYCGQADEGGTFDRFGELTGGKYPLLAYLFFLKDMDRFLPIQPTTFDRAFRALGIELVTLRHCSWENYQNFNAALGEVREGLTSIDGLANARLIDAHSFCWLLERLENDSGRAAKSEKKDAGRILSGHEKSIIAMRYSIENTVRNSNGQIALRTVKDKQTTMNSERLEQLLKSLMEIQGYRCALTGIPFPPLDANSDKKLLPSADRIDSNGHYEAGNIQIVCQFVNFWKGDSDNEDFKRLLGLVQGIEA